ncbi:Sterol desaturase family [Rasamsonia emersonii CBS 393.64]|uniref:Sterol desaturase family n=1 Tax=Rasamsonia emersonii (strain ATCC 16479 / CBS 393.64 / IMI 116815) TaxID=1408163 RepID=A0A0F4YEN8_RASE3|nr:Sterol desaturase family [Rasamsonia emersonii CBS 393.64]KKA16416.1 Sterol desaturase family [Rasamsonia emersonii CBS 393.64]
MTWATLVLSHSPLRVELVGTLAVRIIFYLLPSLLFFLFDILFPSVSVAIKARGELGLPTGSTKPARGLLGIGWKEAKVVAWSLCNLLVCGILAQGVVEHVLTKVLRYRSAIRVSLRLPYPWESVLDILRAFVVREFLTYIIHRFALHSPRSPVSRYHLSWYHSLRVPYPLTAHYDHPIPYLLLKVVPLYASAAAFRFHMTTYMLFVALVSLEETFAYSGYKTLPTGFFLGGVARRAEMHVIRNNGGGGGGNCYFGVWGVLDWLCGTTAPAVEDHEQQEEEDQLAEEDIDEKMIRKAIEEYRRLLREKKGNGNKTRRRRVNNNR